MFTGEVYKDLPFSYDVTARYLAGKYKMQVQDPDFQDRYHDSLEMFLRHWNGEGNPVGAISLMFSQWYTHHRKAKYNSLVLTLQELSVGDLQGLPFEDEEDGRSHSIDGVVWLDLTEQIQVDQFRRAVRVVLEQESDRNKALFLMHLKDYSSSAIALALDMKRQRVDFIINRTLESIKKVLVI